MKKTRGGGTLKFVFQILLVIGLIIMIRQAPFVEIMEPWLKAVSEAGWPGAVLFVGFSVLLLALWVPIPVPMAFSGVFYEAGWGYLIASLIMLATSALGYGLGFFFANSVQKWPLLNRPAFRSFQRVIQHKGAGMILLLRMTPFFPFWAGSLLLGSLKVKFLSYWLFTLLGSIPAKFLQVYAGSLAHESYTDIEGITPFQTVFFVISCLIFFAVTYWIQGEVRKEMRACGSSIESE